MLVYLAGCMSYYEATGQLEKAIEWRKVAQEKLEDLGYKVFNPMINYSRNRDFVKYDKKCVVDQNIVYLKKTDILLVNMEDIQHSPGTLFEIFYCYLNNIPVVAFNNVFSDYISKPHISESITFHAYTLENAIDFITSMYHLNNY